MPVGVLANVRFAPDTDEDFVDRMLWNVVEARQFVTYVLARKSVTDQRKGPSDIRLEGRKRSELHILGRVAWLEPPTLSVLQTLVAWGNPGLNNPKQFWGDSMCCNT
jgi:hypothetical protein